MKTKIVFRLEHEPAGYGYKFAIDCDFVIRNPEGFVHLDADYREVIGSYTNMRRDGEVLVADIELFGHTKETFKSMDYSIAGHVLKRNEKGEVSQCRVSCVNARAK